VTIEANDILRVVVSNWADFTREEKQGGDQANG
jgi:hypothetical protein